MYETHENNIEWKKIIKKGGIILGVILIALICFTLISKAFNKPVDSPSSPEIQPITLSSQLDEVENALLKFLDEENMPKEINSAKTVRVKLLKDNGFIQELKDSENNSCESNNSFAEITRFEENYAVSITLVCGPNKENRLFYIGCFSECNGSICKGTSEATGGVCFENKTQTTDKVENQKTDTKTSTKTSSTTKKPSSTAKSSTSNTTNNNQTMYEFQKCTTTYSCSKGTLNQSTNKCEYISDTNRLYSNYTVREIKSPYSTLAANNTKSIFYELRSFNNGYYNYKVYECDDSSYTFSSYMNKCYKDIDNKQEIPAKTQTSCDYTWSYSPTLEGWNRTGKTK